jgi:hypothetical protein
VNSRSKFSAIVKVLFEVCYEGYERMEYWLCKCDTAKEIIVSDCSYVWVKIVIKELTI